MRRKIPLAHQRSGQAHGSIGLWIITPLFLVMTLLFMMFIGIYMYITIAREKAEAAREDEEKAKLKQVNP